MNVRLDLWQNLSPVAQHAVRAARNRHIWGRLPTLQYARKHRVPHGLLTTAITLANAERAGISI